jgi:hypothetical protein
MLGKTRTQTLCRNKTSVFDVDITEDDILGACDRTPYAHVEKYQTKDKQTNKYG